MNRVLAAAIVVALLAPVAGAIAVACFSTSCCAAKDDRVARLMECCEETMCASPSPARQAKATEVSQVAVSRAVDAEPAEPLVPTSSPRRVQSDSSPPRSTSVRLALVATLLI